MSRSSIIPRPEAVIGLDVGKFSHLLTTMNTRAPAMGRLLCRGRRPDLNLEKNRSP